MAPKTATANKVVVMAQACVDFGHCPASLFRPHSSLTQHLLPLPQTAPVPSAICPGRHVQSGSASHRLSEFFLVRGVRARQEQLEADVRRTWGTHEPQQGVHSGYTGNDTRVISFKSRRKNGGGGGSRTPVRKALRPEAYMLSSIRLGSPAAVRMSKKRNRLVR